MNFCFVVSNLHRFLSFRIAIAFELQPTQSEFNAIEKVKEEQKRRLYKIFGENARGTQEERDEKIAEFQRRLFEEEFGENGNKLRDYQAEGVAWLISNYVNKRSSVLADEVRLFFAWRPLDTIARTLLLLFANEKYLLLTFNLFVSFHTFAYEDGTREDSASCFVSEQARKGISHPWPVPDCSSSEHHRALASGVRRVD